MDEICPNRVNEALKDFSKCAHAFSVAFPKLAQAAIEVTARAGDALEKIAASLESIGEDVSDMADELADIKSILENKE